MQGRACHNARRDKFGEREPVSRRGAKAASYKEEGFILNPSSSFNGLGQAVMPGRGARRWSTSVRFVRGSGGAAGGLQAVPVIRQS